MEFLPEDSVLHKYVCAGCSLTTISMSPIVSCVECGSTVLSVMDSANSIHVTEQDDRTQFDSIASLDEWIDDEAEREDLEKSTRNVEKLRRGIGVEEDVNNKAPGDDDGQE